MNRGLVKLMLRLQEEGDVGLKALSANEQRKARLNDMMTLPADSDMSAKSATSRRQSSEASSIFCAISGVRMQICRKSVFGIGRKYSDSPITIMNKLKEWVVNSNITS